MILFAMADWLLWLVVGLTAWFSGSCVLGVVVGQALKRARLATTIA